jgi:hypothetical protein
MLRNRVIVCLAGSVLFAGAISAIANETAVQWRLASKHALLAATGGTGACNIKCANPTSCPSGTRYACGTPLCSGSGPCSSSSGTDTLPSTYCTGCDKAAAGKKDCNGSISFYCQRSITCQTNCTFVTNGGYWACLSISSIGIGTQVIDKSPSGASCP